jgi:AraC-like DNA-binding protein
MGNSISSDKLVVRWNALKRAYTFYRSSASSFLLYKSYIYYVFFIIILSQQFCHAQQWITASSSQVEILTSNNERETRAALQIFENARKFFLNQNTLSGVLNKPVRVFAFQSKAEYAPYRLNSNAFGHFLHNQQCDYIVLEDIKPEHYEAALHEYTHYVIKQAGLSLPTWLNEGIADLYSSLGPNGQKTMVGRLLPGRTAVLESEPPMNLRALFAVTPDSSYYNESDKLPIFYAQSWALTHMLALDKQYSIRFPDFLKMISSGVSSPDAFLRVYGKNLEQVELDFSQYRPRMAANTASFDIQLGNSFVESQVKVLPDDEKMLALADLLAAHPATAPRALQTLTELAKQNPNNPLIEERLGYAAWNMSRVDDARSYFAHAVEHGSRDSDMIYRYAVMQKQAGASDEEVMRLFERVLELSPDLDDARFHLGLLQFNGKKFSIAAQSLSKLKAVKEEWAYAYYSVMAYCDIKFSNVEEAKIFGEKAKVNAKTRSEQSQADRLLLYLQAQGSSTH